MKLVVRIMISLLAATFCVVVNFGVPIGAQEQPSGASGSIAMENQSSWVGAGQAFSMDLHVSTSLPVDQVDIVVTVFNALNNRSSFNQTLTNKFGGSPVILERSQLSDVLDSQGIAHISLPVGDATQRRYYLRDNGVYPVRVELLETGTTKLIDQMSTDIINEPNIPPPSNRLEVSVVLPVQEPLSADAKNVLTTPDSGSNTLAIANAITANPNIPITVAAQPETLERLAKTNGESSQDALSKLSQATKGHSVIRSTWSPIPSALYENDLSHEADEQLQRGDQTLTKYLSAPDLSTFNTTDSLDSTALNSLRSSGVNRLVIPQNLLIAQSQTTTPARPFVVSLGKGKPNIPAVQADAGLAAHFDQTADPILAAHQLLADLTVIWNDLPGQQREVVVEPDTSWTPSTPMLQTFLQALASNPVLTPATLDQAFAVTPDGSSKAPLQRQMTTPPKPAAAVVSASRIKDSRQRLVGFSSMVQPENTMQDELARRLLYSESSDFETKDRSAQLDAFKTLMDKQLNSIRMPSNRSLQLTARKGEIPVSIENDTGYPVTLQVKLESDKLEFPSGDIRTITVDHQSATVPFEIDARTSGAFPVQVLVQSPDGTIVISHSRVTVRSTATTGIGVGLSIGAGAFLFLWWTRSWWKSRSKNKLATSQSRESASSSELAKI